MRDHTGEEASGEGATRETKDVDSITFVVVSHQEAVAGDHVGVEAGRQALIDYSFDFTQKATEKAHVYRAFCRVSPNARCNLVSKFWVISRSMDAR